MSLVYSPSTAERSDDSDFRGAPELPPAAMPPLQASRHAFSDGCKAAPGTGHHVICLTRALSHTAKREDPPSPAAVKFRPFAS
ncbi:hypothetical protein SNOG_05183 [Parastagonospora nodorum SN15]|uniref:Uncharacterized protein n=1 Tax=Phaeosphaeria nodorum (strain SN15 / ATCC MYA-4574 / FGSC 10173) TaxID=321614 RepID=Q0UST1_PHANO|nr:hypothetical protein SNOG_05183 [Parastagonospora nodorum SN15]EAT87574.1 hypothetical protein SNOG_05183 [Parastagonospora nodorum SN15]